MLAQSLFLHRPACGYRSRTGRQKFFQASLAACRLAARTNGAAMAAVEHGRGEQLLEFGVPLLKRLRPPGIGHPCPHASSTA